MIQEDNYKILLTNSTISIINKVALITKDNKFILMLEFILDWDFQSIN